MHFYEKRHFLPISEANLHKKFPLSCFINNSEKDQCFCCYVTERKNLLIKYSLSPHYFTIISYKGFLKSSKDLFCYLHRRRLFCVAFIIFAISFKLVILKIYCSKKAALFAYFDSFYCFTLNFSVKKYDCSCCLK